MSDDESDAAPDQIVRALYDYTALSNSESELSFRAGDEWFFVALLPGGWVCVEDMSSGKMSHVPEGYVTIVAAPPSDDAPAPPPDAAPAPTPIELSASLVSTVRRPPLSLSLSLSLSLVCG